MTQRDPKEYGDSPQSHDAMQTDPADKNSWKPYLLASYVYERQKYTSEINQ